MELGIRFAGNLPIAQIAVLRAVDLADGFLLDGDALHGFNRDAGAHADTAPGFDDPAEGGGWIESSGRACCRWPRWRSMRRMARRFPDARSAAQTPPGLSRIHAL